MELGRVSDDEVTLQFIKRCFREKQYLDGELTIEELQIQLERDNLEDLISQGLSIGMEYSEIMKMDNKRFWLVYRGKVSYLEKVLGYTRDINKEQAMKFAQALTDVKGFNKDSKPLKLLKENALEKRLRIAKSDEIPKDVVREIILGGG